MLELHCTVSWTHLLYIVRVIILYICICMIGTEYNATKVHQMVDDEFERITGK